MRRIQTRRCRGSLSVEAAMALSLFLFAVVCMMMPMRIMDRQRQIQAELEALGERFCQYAYLTGEGTDAAEIGVSLTGIWQLKGNLEKRGVEKISFMNSSVLRDGETVSLVMDYEMELPFSVLGLNNIPMKAKSFRRAWVGRDGPLGETADGSDSGKENEEEKERTVYVGRDSIRYHKSPDCHYLSNKLQAVAYEDLESYRNASGSRYRACSRCGKPAGPGSVIYIMPSGESYHLDRDCSAIIAYVEEVPLSEAEHLGKCSYCW